MNLIDLLISSALLDNQPIGTVMEPPAIQNLDFLRQLIRDRNDMPEEDAERLRMIQGTGMGTDALTTKRGDE